MNAAVTMSPAPEGTHGRYIEVCAGAGGLALGLTRAGWSGTGIEFDPDAAATHRQVGPCLEADVVGLPAPHGADFVAGGVPCQPFSMAGLGRCLDDDRGGLFRELLRIAEEAGARAVLIENVRGMVSRGAVHPILAEIRAAGFHCTYALLNAADYGVPQNRKRLFIVGFRDKAALARFRFPAPTHGAPNNLFGLPRWRTVRDALSLPAGDYRTGRMEGASGWNGQRFVDADLPANTITASKATDFLSPLDRPANTILASEGSDGARGARGGKARGRGAGYALSQGLATLKHSRLDEPAPTISAGGADTGGAEPLANARVRREFFAALEDAGLADRPGTSISCDPRLPAAGHHHHHHHQDGAVRLSPRQCARLQSFPDDFEFVGNTRKSLHRQIGNAVPPPLGEALGRAVYAALYGVP